MDSEQSTLDVDGQTIRMGTSLFDFRTQGVLWYTDVRNGMVQLETLEGDIELPEEEFRAYIQSGKLRIQTHPPAPPE